MTIGNRTIGLALSGGGFRATLFGLGSLWRLNDAGLLRKIDRITSVSGGSILAGILAHRWTKLDFAGGGAGNFVEVIVDPVQSFCRRTIDIGAGLKGIVTPFKTAGDYLSDLYAKDLFGDAMLRDLPAASKEQVPRFIFYATNMQTGRSFRFRQDIVADYVLGVSGTVEVSLADVVAASSAFPPIFSPIILKTKPESWENPDKEFPGLNKLRRRIVLADGGVYDNMGLESLWGNVDIVLVSDAGAPFKIDPKPFEDDLLQLGRVRDILIDQTRSLRKRWLMSELESGRYHGAYWGIGTAINEYKAPGALAKDNALTATLESIPTRLCRFSEKDQGHLINWGYALADAALRSRANLSLPKAAHCPIVKYPI
ncbi:MAG: patatin-like phospholipase family protein [Acidobacteria bacterium]|nr:patatin-like phospholipase family protein [Acidobacteriota bacterium]